MARKFRVGWALGAAVCVICGAAGAHHGTAAYDMSKLVTVVGTVTDFEFINPHSEVYFEVKDRAGKVEKWEAEAGSVTGMVRAGWKKSLLKPGDRATFTGNQSKNGSYTMRLRTIMLVNGQKLEIERGEDYAN